jgi:pilus assembly protein Flp/PilA
VLTRLRSRPVRETGAPAFEYGLLIAAIAAVVVGMVFVLGNWLSSTLSPNCQGIATGTSCGPQQPGP